MYYHTANKKIITNKGQAMILTVLFFLVLSTSIAIGLVSPVVREFQITSKVLDSKQSYFLAESGAEDASYRIKNNKQISATEVLSLNGHSATTTIASIGSSEKSIVSLGDVANNNRRVALSLKTGDGVVFKYGTQAGRAGIFFKNNAGLNGSLYSNGNILGSNGAFITGDAFVANTPALTADQTNDSPSSPTDSITFGTTNGTQDVAQSFKLNDAGFINNVELYIKKVSTPTNATVRITTDNNGQPSTTTVATGTLNTNAVSTNYGWISVSLSTVQLLNNVTYWIVIDRSTDASKYYIIGANSTYANGQAMIGQYGGTWNATNPVGLDIYFRFYLGGFTGLIDNMDIGTGGIGEAHAHTITDATATGTMYCQIGTGNNKACDTSRADPSPENLPISDANILDWKNDALSGGVINGDDTVSGTSTLGPKKINGNLVVSGTLTLADTLWVTGNIDISGTVKLDASYGTTTGIIIADGYIHLGNNVVFQDSGTAGSYIMLLSTSVCDGDTPGNPCGAEDAISVRNNSDIIIANAQNGTVSFNNNASVKEVVGNRITLQNNSIVSYGSGLINVDFTSGPSGGWVVSSWKETE